MKVHYQTEYEQRGFAAPPIGPTIYWREITEFHRQPSV